MRIKSTEAKTALILSMMALTVAAVPAVAAAAEPTITVTPTQVVTGQAITLTVSGVTPGYGYAEDYTVNLLLGANECQKEHQNNKTVSGEIGALTFEAKLYEALGTYRLCLYAGGPNFTEQRAETTFEVVTRPVLLPAPTVTPTPSVATPVAPIAAPVAQPAKTPAKTLKPCQRIKNKRARVQCERKIKKHHPKKHRR